MLGASTASRQGLAFGSPKPFRVGRRGGEIGPAGSAPVGTTRQSASRSRCPALGSLVLLLGVIAPCRVAAIHAQDDKWVRVVTPHFVIVSDASEKKARGVGIALERFHAEVDGGSTKDPTEAFVPTTIVAFADKESFQPYKLKTDGTPESYVGVFATSPDGNFIGLGLDVEEAREYHNQRVPTRGAKDTRSIHGVGTWEVGVPLEIKHGGILCSD